MGTFINGETAGASAIAIDSISKTYIGKKRVRVEALKNVSLTVGLGEVFGFLGPNGAGKSTTIKCLVGLMRPTKGTATIMGESIPSIASRRNIGYLPENPSFYDYLSAEEYIRFVGSAFQMPADELTRKSEEVLKLLELWDARKRPIRSYSKGMVQRVGLAQVLVHDPDVFILDEPMSGLDPLGRSLVKEIISDLKRRGKTVFFSTHIIDDVEKICDRVGIISGGVLKSVEHVDRILEQGVTGYTITAQNGKGETLVLSVDRDGLGDKLTSLAAVGCTVSLIEPVRKNLERFFLDIIKESKGPE
ncbi:MAG TPA: ABC transporter ATP-binding protein [Bellilinea sp.]|nr:ABC transporter ATP-binding protein [Bellilinea sp.]